MDRRQFLCLAGSGLWGCAAAVSYQGQLRDGRVLIGLADLAAALSAKGYALVQAAGLDDPILIYRTGEGAYRALSARCTHLGCQVRPARHALICPCHGSSFSWEGAVLRGPAQQALRQFRVEAKEDVLEITVD